jgi:prepilin-type N-terminal cleavage/methylation domain-containing protein|tara:strand:- start:290 stop:730 length:441 start_codon:yes stop_codon:yes gene_type:complete
MTKSSGFTLIELLVVVAIIGILSAIGTVSYNGYVEGSKKKAAENVLMQIGLAQTDHYADCASYFSSAGEYCDTAAAEEECDANATTTSTIGTQLFGKANYIDVEAGGFVYCTYTQNVTAYTAVAKGLGDCKITTDNTGAIDKSECN